MHLWIVFAGVDLSRAFLDRPVDSLLTFVDCVHEYGSLACICGLCVRVWISRVHLWEDLILFSLHVFYRGQASRSSEKHGQASRD